MAKIAYYEVDFMYKEFGVSWGCYCGVVVVLIEQRRKGELPLQRGLEIR